MEALEDSYASWGWAEMRETPEKPVILLHLGRGIEETLHVLSQEAHTLEIDVVPVLSMPSYGPERLAGLASMCLDYLPAVIVDPMPHRHRLIVTDAYVTQTMRRHYAALYVDSPPTRPVEQWVRAFLQHQQNAGATFFVSPSKLIEAGNLEEALSFTIDAFHIAQEVTDDPRRLFVGLTADWQVLASGECLDSLLNRVIHLDANVFYIRVRWPHSERYAELHHRETLEGYKELTAVLRREGFAVLYPNTGTTGWLALAFGSSGFGTGPTDDQQAFRPLTFFKRQKGSRAARPRYFSERLLSWLPQGTPSRELSTRGGLTEPLHYLVTIARLTKKVTATGDPRAAIRDIVADALSLATQLSRRRPYFQCPHLPVWAEVLK